MNQESSHRFKVIAAFAALYLIWGSTYLAIRIALGGFPPATLAAVRFMVSGPILLSLALFRGVKLPNTFEEYKNCAVVGLLFLLCGNGGVVWAEQYVPSGLTALLVATMPFGVVGVERLWKKGERPGWLGNAGILIGFLGVLLLMWPDLANGFSSPVAGDRRLAAEIVLIIISFLWAFGSVYAKHASMPKDAMMSTAWQMIFGGVALTAVSFFRGELDDFHADKLTQNSVLAMAYLIILGSCIGFTSYSWLLKNVPATKVATYAYVNPVVAIFLGWIFADEALTGRTIVAMTVILAGVVMVSRDKIRTATQSK